MKWSIFYIFLFAGTVTFAMPVYAQMGQGMMGGDDQAGTCSQQKSGLMHDMSSQMNAMSSRMMSREMTLAMRKQMSEQMKEMSDMMASMSSMGECGKRNPNMLQQMHQMHERMNQMMGSSAPGKN